MRAKYVALCNAGGDGVITSFAYFQNPIQAAASLQVSDDYWRYLRHRDERLELEWAGKVRHGSQRAGQADRCM